MLTPDERVIPVDSGFIVHNDKTYPNLLRLFGELGVETKPTDMSMSVRCEAAASSTPGRTARWCSRPAAQRDRPALPGHACSR
ncbi:MAG: hypothetical protein U0W40_19975 [Acidimicrobiia bacterium]